MGLGYLVFVWHLQKTQKQGYLSGIGVTSRLLIELYLDWGNDKFSSLIENVEFEHF
jgi:hypothetical protein